MADRFRLAHFSGPGAQKVKVNAQAHSLYGTLAVRVTQTDIASRVCCWQGLQCWQTGERGGDRGTGGACGPSGTGGVGSTEGGEGAAADRTLAWELRKLLEPRVVVAGTA